MSRSSLPPLIQAALDSFGSEDLLDAADRLGVRFLGRGFEEEAELRESAERVEGDGIRGLFALLIATRADDAARPLARAIAEITESVEEASVLEALRWLADHGDADDLRLALPLMTRRWFGGAATLSASRVPDKAAIAVEVLRAVRPCCVEEPLDWAAATDAQGPERGEFPRHGRLLLDCWPSADEETRETLQALARELYTHASTVCARVHMMQCLVEMGDRSVLPECQASALSSLRDAGVEQGLQTEPRETLQRHAAALREGGDLADSLMAEVGRHEMLTAVRCPKTPRLAVLFLGVDVVGNRFEYRASELVWLDLEHGTWGASAWLEPLLARGGSISIPKKYAGKGVVLFEGDTSEFQTVRWYLVARGTRVLWAKNQSALAEVLQGAEPAPPPQRKPKPREEPSAPPPPPKGLYIAEVGKGASSYQGKLAVPGATLVGLFRDGEPWFVPPQAVHIGVSEHRIVSWRVVRKAEASGVARGDYHWIVEVFARDPEDDTAAPTFERCHRVRSQQVIDWHWPGQLRFAKSHRHRLVSLVGYSEDGRAEVHVALHDDGTFSESEDRAAALALLGKGKGDPANAVATHVAPSERPPMPRRRRG